MSKSFLDKWEERAKQNTEIIEKQKSIIEWKKKKNMNIYKVYSTDDYGRPEDILGYVKADSEHDARVKMSIVLYGDDDTEIVTTGYYGAKMVSSEEYNLALQTAKMELDKFNL